MDNEISTGIIDSTGEPRSSLYLPSVKTWNEHIRRNTFVKDHTAVPLQNLARDHSTWSGVSGENPFSVQNGVANSTESQRPYTDVTDSVTSTNSNDKSTSLKKAFEMASRTRDMLNKLDGWKALSIKTYPTSSPQTTVPTSGGYMIKSSSQFTTLDAKSTEAKNILQNIKDMAQILCPPEYGGVSHFRIMHEANQDAGHTSNVSRIIGAESTQDTGAVRNNMDFNQSSVMHSTTASTVQQNSQSLCISSSRINIIGRSSKPIVQCAPNQIMHNNNIGMSECAVTSSGIENGQSLSHVLNSYTGNEAQRHNFVKVRALYDDLMSKLNTSKQESTTVSETKSESLYEDFDDGTFSLVSGNQAPFSSSVPTYDHLAFDLQKSTKTNSHGMENTQFARSSRIKDHNEWEKETQDFLRKLNVMSGGMRKDSREEFVSSTPRHLLEMDKFRSKEPNDRPNKAYYSNSGARSASKSSSSSLNRLRSSGYTCDAKLTNREDVQTHRMEKSSRLDDKFPFKSMNPTNSRHSSDKFKNRDNGNNPKDSSQKLIFYDDCSHSCKDCGLTNMKLSSYLDHLLKEDHVKKMSDVPSSWNGSKFNESSLIKPKTGKVLPIRGSESIFPVTAGFYCRPCKTYFPNKDELLHHLSSKSHDEECYFYSNARKRYNNTSSPIPVKKSKIDTDESQAKPSSALSQKNDVLSSVRSVDCKTTLNSKKKEQPKKSHTNIKSNSVPKQPLQTLPKSKRDDNVTAKPIMQDTAPNPIQTSSTSQEKSEDMKSGTCPVNNTKVIQTPQKSAEANAGYDVESESDFLELDEWTEDV